MTVLADVKAALRVTHTDDDALITRLIDSASQECALYLYGAVPDYTATGAPADPQTVPALLNGIIVMVQGDYDGDPAKRGDYVAAARGAWVSLRTDWAA